MGNNVAPYSESSTIGNNFSQNDMFLHVIASQDKLLNILPELILKNY